MNERTSQRNIVVLHIEVVQGLIPVKKMIIRPLTKLYRLSRALLPQYCTSYNYVNLFEYNKEVPAKKIHFQSVLTLSNKDGYLMISDSTTKVGLGMQLNKTALRCIIVLTEN